MTLLSPILEIAAYVLLAAGALHWYAKRFQAVPGLAVRVYVGLLCLLMLAAAIFSLVFEVPPAAAPSHTLAQALGLARHRTLVVIGMGGLCLALLARGTPRALALALLCILVAALKGLAHSVFLTPEFDIYQTGLAAAILASDALALALASAGKQSGPPAAP